MDETFVYFAPMGNATTLEVKGTNEVKATAMDIKMGCTVAVTITPKGKVLPLHVGALQAGGRAWGGEGGGGKGTGTNGRGFGLG